MALLRVDDVVFEAKDVLFARDQQIVIRLTNGDTVEVCLNGGAARRSLRLLRTRRGYWPRDLAWSGGAVEVDRRNSMLCFTNDRGAVVLPPLEKMK